MFYVIFHSLIMWIHLFNIGDLVPLGLAQRIKHALIQATTVAEFKDALKDMPAELRSGKPGDYSRVIIAAISGGHRLVIVVKE
jgi:hypothetical protein